MNPPTHILLVDHNPNDVELALHALSKHRVGNRVTVLRDGEEALDYVFCAGQFAGRTAADDPHVLLLDLTLPKLNGIEVLRALRSAGHTRRIPVVMLTTSREEAALAARSEAGADACIVKPVDFANFAEAMRLIGKHWVLLNEPPFAQHAA